MPISVNGSAAAGSDTTSKPASSRLSRQETRTAENGVQCRLVPADLAGPFDPPKWLWDGRVPLHELTILAGRGEVGKTTIALDLAAQLSRGHLPGAMFGHRGKTIFFSDEASLEQVIAPRYAAALGQDHSLYGSEFVETTEDDVVTRPMTLDPADLRALAETINEERIDLLIFDPIDMLLGAVDSHRNNEVRAALRLIMSVGCTVLGIQHITKSSSVAHAGDRVMGSVAYRNFARSVLLVDRDKNDQDVVVLAHDKSNAGPRRPSLSLRTVASHIDGYARVEWLSEIAISADDLLQRTRGPSLTEQAQSWLNEYLESEGPTAPSDVLEAASVEGFGRSTVYLARKILGVNTRDRLWTL